MADVMADHQYEEEYEEGGEYAVEYDDYYNDDYNYNTGECIDQGLNIMDPSNDKIKNLYDRRIISGDCFKLPDTAECPDDIWDAWMAAFMTGLKDDEFQKSKKFRYLWTTDREDGIVSTVKYGVAGSVEDLVSLIKQGFVRRTDVQVPGSSGKKNPTVANWQAFTKLVVFQMTKVDESDDGPAVEATADEMKEIADGIVSYITGGWYDGYIGTKGLGADTYLGEYKSNVSAMRAAYDHGNKCLCTDLTEPFVNGVYRSYKDVIYAVRRRYNRCRTQETMVDWFNHIDRTVSGTSPMEFKIQKLRFLMGKIFVTEKDNFPRCSDFPGDMQVQQYPEEYNPAINSLLTYLIFKESVPKNRWEAVQRAYHQEVKGKVDYKSWHENRGELWPILDREHKRKSSLNVVVNQNGNAVDVNNVRQQQRPRQRFQQQQRQLPQRPLQRPQYRTTFQQSRNRLQPPRQNNQSNQRFQSRNRLQRLLCRNCSKWAGTNKYHQPTFGGTPNSNCPYDRNGRIRPGYRFIGRIDGTDVTEFDIPDVATLDNEGIEYEEENTNPSPSSITNYQ